jgi:hypothetical protein
MANIRSVAHDSSTRQQLRLHVDEHDDSWRSQSRDHLQQSTPDTASIIISYAICDTCNAESCDLNADYFLANALVADTSVRYIFTISNKSKLHNKLKALSRSQPNVEVTSTTKRTDAEPQQIHGNIIRQHLQSADLYVFLSCRLHGPFYRRTAGSMKPSLEWLTRYKDKLQGKVKAVSATISCQSKAHIQSHAVVMDHHAAEIAASVWTEDDPVDDLIFSDKLLAAGFSFAALDSRYADRDFLAADTICDPEYNHLASSPLIDPLVCHTANGLPMLDTPGCRGVDPCEVVFVKSGPNLAKETVQRMSAENASSSTMCSLDVALARPYWDLASLYADIRSYPSNMIAMSQHDNSSSLAIIIRAHAGYTYELISLLWRLEAIHPLAQSDKAESKIIVVIVPTEIGSMSILKQRIHSNFLINQNRKSTVQVLPMDVPDWIFDRYGSYVLELCSERWKTAVIASKLHSAMDVSRHCEINSPLHYLLVDIALHHILQSCSSCHRLLVTNADNLYSPRFFDTALSPSNQQFDLVITNMVTRGVIFPVQAKKGHVDLGAYATSIDFLRRTGLRFLSSLPSHPQANDYHDADGHFLVKMIECANARYTIIPDYLFYHV